MNAETNQNENHGPEYRLFISRAIRSKYKEINCIYFKLFEVLEFWLENFTYALWIAYLIEHSDEIIATLEMLSSCVFVLWDILEMLYHIRKDDELIYFMLSKKVHFVVIKIIIIIKIRWNKDQVWF